MFSALQMFWGEGWGEEKWHKIVMPPFIHSLEFSYLGSSEILSPFLILQMAQINTLRIDFSGFKGSRQYNFLNST
jgi:hypothetical protein